MLGTGITTIRHGTITTRTTTTELPGSGIMQRIKDGDVTLDDLYKAYVDCRKRKKGKDGAIAFEPYAIHTLCCLRDEINERRYKLKPSQCFVVKYPVPREVFCASFRDRIVQHFIYNELNPVMEKMLIYDTASCRVGKGTDFAIQRVATLVKRETENCTRSAYFGKMDISGFFMNIGRQILLDKVLWIVENRYHGRYSDVLRYLLPIEILSDVTIKAKRLSPLKDWELIPKNKTLFGNSKGLPIGNITSQLFANFYLNDIDHFIKSRHRGYERYVDDSVIVDSDRERIKETIDMVSPMLESIGLKLNSRKSYVSDVKYGINFLGIKVFPHYSVLTGKRINRMWFTSRRFPSVEKAFLSCSSRKGMLNRYHGKMVSERWYQSLPDNVREHLRMDTDAHFHLVDGKKVVGDGIKDIRMHCSG